MLWKTQVMAIRSEFGGGDLNGKYSVRGVCVYVCACEYVCVESVECSPGKSGPHSVRPQPAFGLAFVFWLLLFGFCFLVFGLAFGLAFGFWLGFRLLALTGLLECSWRPLGMPLEASWVALGGLRGRKQMHLNGSWPLQDEFQDSSQPS